MNRKTTNVWQRDMATQEQLINTKGDASRISFDFEICF